MVSESCLHNFLQRLATVSAYVLVSAGCAGLPAVDMSAGHVLTNDEAEIVEPEFVAEPQPEPKPLPPEPTYTVVVKEVPVVDLLFSLARDAGLNLDLQADSDKLVTINAVDRPLREILDRVAEQTRLRFDLRGNNLIIQDDVPFWKTIGSTT